MVVEIYQNSKSMEQVVEELNNLQQQNLSHQSMLKALFRLMFETNIVPIQVLIENFQLFARKWGRGGCPELQGGFHKIIFTFKYLICSMESKYKLLLRVI